MIHVSEHLLSQEFSVALLCLSQAAYYTCPKSAELIKTEQWRGRILIIFSSSEVKMAEWLQRAEWDRFQINRGRTVLNMLFTCMEGNYRHMHIYIYICTLSLEFLYCEYGSKLQMIYLQDFGNLNAWQMQASCPHLACTKPAIFKTRKRRLSIKQSMLVHFHVLLKYYCWLWLWGRQGLTLGIKPVRLLSPL